MKIRIRTKLAAALAIPLVALVGVAGYEANEASQEAARVRTETEIAKELGISVAAVKTRAFRGRQAALRALAAGESPRLAG